MPTTIMTEKIARRGVRVPSDYSADFLDQISAGEAASRPAQTLRAGDPIAGVRAWLASGGPGTRHQGFPVVDDEGRVVGVVTQREIFEAPHETACVADLVRAAPIVVREDESLRDVADRMADADVGRLPVVGSDARLLGILTRSDLVSAHRRRLADARRGPRGQPAPGGAAGERGPAMRG